MGKLTLSCADRLIAVYELDGEPMTIGTDPDCRVLIDSPAIAPRHAELLMTPGGYLLLALDQGFPVRVNDQLVERANLKHGDTVGIGEYRIGFFDTDALPIGLQARGGTRGTDGRRDDVIDSVPAYIQVQSGPKIGRVILLRRTVTRLYRAGVDYLAVTRDGQRHFLVRLKQETGVRVDGRAMVGDEMPLNDKAAIEVGSVTMRFFTRGTKRLGDRSDNPQALRPGARS
jgi:hypothetical protein